MEAVNSQGETGSPEFVLELIEDQAVTTNGDAHGCGACTCGCS
ncbi:hypothetical protein [Actinomadura rupiterrae]|nr:hypothetical protein [Actinomadura rupiterrae]MCP2342169.1 hypothetical protein [Actinomadura rupiterrae]